MAKGRVRVREFRPRTDVAGELEFTDIMSDILFDEAWELLGIHAWSSTEGGPGVVAYIGLAKNSSGQEAISIPETLQTKTGPFYHFEPNGISPAGTKTFTTDVRNYPYPIQFDENDKLNMWIYSGSPHITGFLLDIFWRKI
ncbi:hypothetical protein ES705_42863 [subsurface metagenome]